MTQDSTTETLRSRYLCPEWGSNWRFQCWSGRPHRPRATVIGLLQNVCLWVSSECPVTWPVLEMRIVVLVFNPLQETLQKSCTPLCTTPVRY